MRTNDEGLLVPAVSGDELTASIPALKSIAQIQSQQISNVPSAQMTPALMLSLRRHIITALNDDNVLGAIVVHGTDTMEETAFFLDACLSDSELNHKPVVLTGAMRSNDEPSSDGAANLLAAAHTIASPAAQARGVMIVMNNEIHAARFVRKMDTSSVQTFSSPQHMPIGTVTHSSGVTFHSTAKRFTPAVHVSRETIDLPRADIVTMYAGADATLLNASVEAGAQAIVVQAVGASSVNLELYAAIKEALSKNIAIIISSRSPLGVCAPVYGYTGGGKSLAQLGAVFSHDLPAHKARLLAQLLLSTSTSATHNLNIITNGFTHLTS